MNMLRTGQTWLRNQRRTHYSDAVSYQSHVESPIACKATRARFDTAAIEDSNRIEGRMVDWLIDVSELIVSVAGHGIQRLGRDVDFGFGRLGDPPTVTPVVPRVGDRIVADGKTYEVSTGLNGSHWDYHDRAGQTYRIHTVEVAS